MSFSIDDILQTLKIVKECDNSELHLEIGDVKLSVFKGNIGDSTRSSLDFSGTSTISQSKPVEQEAVPTVQAEQKPQEAASAPIAPIAEDETIEDGLIPIVASVTSVFYRRPAPDQPPFVEVGREVEEDSVVCLLEVMKCFRSVTAGVRGRIEKICVENAELAEQGTVLFLVRPA